MSYYRQGPIRPGGGGIGGIGIPPLTPFVKYLIIANAAVWLLLRFTGGASGTIFGILGLIPERVVFWGWLWQPLTYMFLHDLQVGHLLVNMLILWMFGGQLEQHWGSRAFLRYYLVSGVGAGICIVLVGLLTGPRTLTYGASGAVFGIIIAFGVVFAERTVLFMMIFPMKARTLAMVMAGLELIYLLPGQGQSGVSNIAHVGGALTGFLYLKRAWRVGDLYRELRWKIRRRRFKIMPPDDDRWVN